MSAVRYATVGQPRTRRRDLAVAAVLAAIAVVLWAGLDRPAEMAVIRGLRGTVLRPFIATHEVFESRAGLVTRAAELESRADTLALRVLASAPLADENRRLRELLDLPDRETGDFFIVELIPGRTPGGEPNGFQLRSGVGGDAGADAGERRGGGRRADIRPPLAVATPDGLLGVVRASRGTIGMGDYWTHPDFRVAVVTEDGAATGIVRPFIDEAGDELMLLQGVPFQTDVPAGAVLVTSGVGGIYPRGLPVGTVLAEHEQQLGWTHSFLVEPAVRPGVQTVAVAWQPAVVVDDADDSVGAAADGTAVEATGAAP